MFTFRSSSYQTIQYLLIVFVSSEVIAQQAPFKCAGLGEYCLNHWDCCSNACLSYMYRCARGYSVYPYPFLGVSYNPTVTLEQIIDQHFGQPNALPEYQGHAEPDFASRFGGNDEVAATEIQIVLQKPENTASQETVSKNPVDLKETSETLATKLNSIGFENHAQSSTSSNSIKLNETSTAAQNSLYEEKTEAQPEIGLETTQESIKKSSDKPDCAKIGEKCYSHEDCCDKLCHGYLHKCVT